MGQTPIYRTIPKPGLALHRIPNPITQEFIDKLSKYEYNGLYDVGPTKVPHFKEGEVNVEEEAE